MKNKPELLSFSDFLMLAPFFDQRQFFAPEIENLKNGLDGLMQSGLVDKDENSIIEYHDKVAVINIEGPLRPGNGWYFSTGYGDIQEAIVELLDSDVETVIQKMETPGGTVKQAFETEEMFEELAKEKRLVSAIEMATSAGALLTFPAKERYLVSKTAQTGSIGVVAEHVDNRIWYKEFWGEVRTSVAKGKFKDAGTDTRGFDDKAKKTFGESISTMFSIFVESASKGLKKSKEQIEAQESRVYIGQDGIDQGFAKGFATLDSLIEKYNQETTTTFSTPGRPAFSNHTQEESMDITKLETDFPDVYKAVFARGKAAGIEESKQTHIQEGEAKGILLERKRMNDIDALSLPPEFAQKAKDTDWSAEKSAAEYLRSEAAKRQEVSKNMESDLEEEVATDSPVMPKEEEAAKNPVDEYKAEVAKHIAEGKSEGQAMKLVKDTKPELHQKYIDAHNKRG